LFLFGTQVDRSLYIGKKMGIIKNWRIAMKPSDNTDVAKVDAYINQADPDIRPRLGLIRTIIREEAPEAIEKISYGMPTFHLHENLVHFAAAKHHIGFYPTPSGVEAFKAELEGLKWSKGAIQFPHNAPLPEELIRKIVRFRVHEVLGK
jgi:uncharacterized protein YdhG (YjbR/CyaY superfamily)